jgi:hypothetical protein
MKSFRVNTRGGDIDKFATEFEEARSALYYEATNGVYQTFRGAGRLMVSPQFDGHEYCIPGSIFCKEYAKNSRTRLDHEALGFSTLSEFIRSIPWARVHKNPGGHCDFLCVAFDRMAPDMLLDVLSGGYGVA